MTWYAGITNIIIRQNSEDLQSCWKVSLISQSVTATKKMN